MTVRVQMFAVAKDLAGAASVELALPEGARVADVRHALVERVPRLAPLAASLLFAVNAEYAQDDAPLPPGADVACIPPVSGG
jgi:molybdopterin converting factor subunit 1